MVKFSLVSVGSTIFCASLLSVFQLPRVTPYEFFNCSVYQGTRQCFGYMNPIYPVVLVISIIGIVFLILGLFGRPFTPGPLFIAGILLIAMSYSGAVLGYLASEFCSSANSPFPSLCPASHQGYTVTFIIIGAVLIAANYFQMHSTLNRSNPRQQPQKIMGIASLAVGVSMLAGGGLLVESFFPSSPFLPPYWMQAIVGAILVFLGIAFIAFSTRDGNGKNAKDQLEARNPCGTDHD